jgi:hypothetical protein
VRLHQGFRQEQLNPEAQLLHGAPKGGARLSRVQAFWPEAKILPQGGFTPPKEVKSGVPGKGAAFSGGKLCDFIKDFDKNN